MRRVVKLIFINHRVISNGRMVARLRVSGERGGAYWF